VLPILPIDPSPMCKSLRRLPHSSPVEKAQNAMPHDHTKLIAGPILLNLTKLIAALNALSSHACHPYHCPASARICDLVVSNHHN
jgi:hypothetical protein